jgi:hypothetical protein
MITPRGGGGGSPRSFDNSAVIDFFAFQKERREGLTKYGSLNQEVIQQIQSTMKNALASGQTVARVQTLQLAYHYSYSRIEPFPKSSLVVHDDFTLEPLAKRINLAARARELTDWLVEQGLSFICSGRVTRLNNLAPYIHVVVLFEPMLNASISSLINTAFSSKNLNDVNAWNTRCVNALRVGAMHAAICLMYVGVDFLFPPPEEAGKETHRIHPTMKPSPLTLTLHNKFTPLLEWLKGTGYTWFAAFENVEEKPAWAYFMVSFEPLKYE